MGSDTLRRVAAWLAAWVVNAALSGLVGGAAGALVALAWASREPPVGVTLGAGGEIAYPGELFATANEEGRIAVRFRPPNLQDVGICEYFSARGWNWADQALDYLRAYPECFLLRRTDAASYEVSPSIGGLRIQELAGGLFCWKYA